MKQQINETLPELISPYLRNLIAKTGGKTGPIGKQFIIQPSEQHAWNSKNHETDPLDEDENEVAPGLIYKYKGQLDNKGNVITYGRALWTVTRFCSSYCRFCTRGREVGLPYNKNKTTGPTLLRKPMLSENDIKAVVSYLTSHKELNEVIVSGGDPLVTSKEYLTQIIASLAHLQKKGHIDIVRIGTRLPIANPPMIADWHYKLVKELKNPYLMVHINHPEELTKESIAVLDRFRKESHASVMSQSVLLRGVNDDSQILKTLFMKLAVNGIHPYYIYQCDEIYWGKTFIVPPKKAIAIWQKVRPELSGIAATARFVIDTTHGFGKIPVPEGDAWHVNYHTFSDFKKKKHIFT